jgi:hypothetical protein
MGKGIFVAWLEAFFFSPFLGAFLYTDISAWDQLPPY